MEDYLDSTLTPEPKNNNIDVIALVDGINCFGFLISLIFLINSTSTTLYTFFIISIVLVHAILFVKTVFPHFQIEADILSAADHRQRKGVVTRVTFMITPSVTPIITS